MGSLAGLVQRALRCFFEPDGFTAGHFSDFSVDQYSEGLSFSHFHNDLAVCVCLLGGGGDFSNTHPLHDVARGLSLREARQPRRTPSWDLFVVLDALRRPPLEPLHSASFSFRL